jgi:Gpi18-like mannosyltransferase
MALLLRLLFAFLTWHPDVNNHVDWGTRFWDYGAKNFYTANVWSYTWPNQPPGTVYIYAGLKKQYDFIHSIFWYINVNVPTFPSNLIFYLESNLYPALLKLPSIFADFGIAYLIYKSISDKNKARLGAVLWLLNPVIWYNSSLWGQTDSLISFFVFLAFYLLTKKKPVLSVLLFALSIYIKASLLIFIPIYILLFISKKFPIGIYFKSIILSLLLVIVLTIPFSKGNPVVWLYYLYQGKVFVQQLQVITANAFNIWATIASIHERPQSLNLGPFTYQLWGTVLFVVSYAVLVISFFKSKTRNLFWLLSMIAFSSFMLMTNMHERYLFPFFPFFTVIAVTDKKLLKLYLLISLISLLNLYNFWWFPKISVVVNFLSFADRLMPRVLGFVMFISYLILFRYFLLQTRTSKINYRD